jgi:hypothetical protein
MEKDTEKSFKVGDEVLNIFTWGKQYGIMKIIRIDQNYIWCGNSATEYGGYVMGVAQLPEDLIHATDLIKALF